MVHPLNESDIRRGCDAEAARGAMPAPAAPDGGMLVRVPVLGGAPDGVLDLGPCLEAPPFQGQRAQHFPPRLDQVQGGRIPGLEHELPARVGKGESDGRLKAVVMTALRSSAV